MKFSNEHPVYILASNCGFSFEPVCVFLEMEIEEESVQSAKFANCKVY